MSERNLYLGMDVHKESVVVAVLPEGAAEPTRVDRVANEGRKLRRYFERVGREGRIRACYEASGAGYVLQRQMSDWGHACEIAASSLIPTRPGDRRKHDRKDATELARLYRAGQLVLIRVPTETEERVRDLVRCRETFQREILKSRHYVLKFLRRRGFVYRGGGTGRSGTTSGCGGCSGRRPSPRRTGRCSRSTSRCSTTSSPGGRSWTGGSRSSPSAPPTGRRWDASGASGGSTPTRRWCFSPRSAISGGSRAPAS